MERRTSRTAAHDVAHAVLRMRDHLPVDVGVRWRWDDRPGHR